MTVKTKTKNYRPHRHSPMGLMLAAAVMTTLAQAQTLATPPAAQQRLFNVPAGPLEQALDRFARAAAVNLSYDAAMVGGLRTRGLAGSYSLTSALSALLQGSGLEAVALPGGGYMLRRPSGDAEPAASAALLASALPVVKVRAVAADGRELPDVGYQARGGTGASKIELSLKDIAQSVTVVNQALLRDLAPARINEVADYVAGVDAFASAATPYTNAFFFRGFGSTSSTTFNGFRDAGFLSAQAPVNLERIEFVKGPASVLYGGSAGLSGLVNFVSKTPSSEPMRELVVGAGSFGRAYAQLDATGPVSADKRLRYRLTAAYDKGGNHRDHYDQRSTFVSPVLSWDLSERTSLDLELLAQNTRFDGRENTLPRHPVSFQLPVRTNLGSGGSGADSRRLARVDLRHRLNETWTLRQGFYASNVDKTDDLSFQFLSVNADGFSGTRRVRSVPELERNRASQTELSGAFTTGRFAHQLLLGLELSKQRFAYEFLVAPATSVDLFKPQPGQQTGPLSFNGAPNESGSETRAIYLQDLIELAGGFKLMLGGRYDDVELFSRPTGGVAAAGSQRDETAFSPRVGLIYQPTPATSVYGSYARSFSPQLGLSRTGESFKPQQGVQLELGVKHDLRPELTISAALFNYRRDNVLTSDPDAAPGSGFNIAVGQQQSRGFELELVGQLTPDYSVMASYGYLDAKVRKDNRLPVGDRLAGVPRHSLGLFNKLRLSSLNATGWSAVAGLVYASERESGLPNSTAAFSSAQLRIPAFTRLDLGLIYEAGDYSFRINGSNLSNEKLYDTQGSVLLARAPRAWTVSLGLRY
ncbi:TonB-dependent receptor [Paucibacter sp. PLA-PC-4]|uniref:TonB-dependent siderophore receptor n=1 Tax=Paucibacter sp. PLA-PC-4 TaxID=2993655 RepID=UPI002248B369|nr:TonB-dependent receptor [Paucibacter sp. PLA-PC-4]MCX2860290.1 TonB-dependent receptor [Paucibacter sp. PLA-PC-4]